MRSLLLLALFISLPLSATVMPDKTEYKLNPGELKQKQVKCQNCTDENSEISKTYLKVNATTKNGAHA